MVVLAPRSELEGSMATNASKTHSTNLLLRRRVPRSKSSSSLRIETTRLRTSSSSLKIGIDSIRQDQFEVYGSMLGTSGQSEIDQDERRLIKNGLITKKVAQYVAYVECDGPAHHTRCCQIIVFTYWGGVGFKGLNINLWPQLSPLQI